MPIRPSGRPYTGNPFSNRVEQLQAQDLHRRLYNYRCPTPGCPGEYRINRALIAASGAQIAIFTDGKLSTSKARCALERAAIRIAKESGARLLNGPADIEGMKIEIEVREAELAGLRARLEAAERAAALTGAPPPSGSA